jgi:glycosyltransferase involved in cell wall biosynthesis
LKVIHIVESLHKGAVENWLVRMFIYGQKNGSNLDWTFYCTEGLQGRLEQLVNDYGGKIIKSSSNWSQPRAFINGLKLELQSGDYKIMHCHHDFMSALYLIAAIGLKIKKIVHVHNMDEHIPTSSSFKAGFFRFVFRRICWYNSDLIVGISKHTLKRFILNRKHLKKKSTILYYGVDYEKFINSTHNKPSFHNRYCIPGNKKIVLFCARIDHAKNPIRALEIFKSLIEKFHDYYFLIVGSGGLEKEIQSFIEIQGLDNNVKHIGWSDNIPLILKNADVLIYPHQTYPMEGLGIVLIETQLSGTPILGSLGIGDDVAFFPRLVKRIDLQESDEKWSEEIVRMSNINKPLCEQIEIAFKKSSFYMPKAMDSLLSLYK